MKFSVNGHSAFAFTGGHEIDPEKKSVLFVHGAALDHTVWTLAARHFIRHGLNVLAIDLPGHGRSGGDARNRIVDYADWIADALDALQVDQCAIVGHSMGSLVALEAAARNPSHFSALVLVGTAVPMFVPDALLDFSSKNKHMAIDLLTAGGHSPNAHLGGNKNPGMWMIGGFMRLMERAAPGVLHHDLTACGTYSHGIESASKIVCPSLLILAENDRLTPVRATRELGKEIKHSKTVVIPESGHSIMSEEPNQFLDLLREIILAE